MDCLENGGVSPHDFIRNDVCHRYTFTGAEALNKMKIATWLSEVARSIAEWFPGRGDIRISWSHMEP